MAGSLNNAKVASFDGKLYLMTNDGTSVKVFDVTDGTVTQLGSAISVGYANSYAMTDATHMIVADGGSFSPKTSAALKFYEYVSDEWVLKSSLDYSARNLSTATVGNKCLLLAESASSGVAGKLFDVSDGKTEEVSGFSVLTGTEGATLSSDGSSFYIVRCDTASSSVSVHTSKDGLTWSQLGDALTSIGDASGATFVNGKAYIVTASQQGGAASLRYHEPASTEGTYDVSMYKGGSDDAGSWTYPTKDGYAFAGWYSDSDCTEAYAATTGQAYARFVPVTELVSCTGADLRGELEPTYGYERTTLRFCYQFAAPSGSTSAAASWWCKNAKTGGTKSVPAANYWLAGGDSVVANVALTGIERDGSKSSYDSAYELKGRISYVTADGTEVSVEQAEASSASVAQVASSIASGSCASAADKAYANGILAE